MIIKEEEKFLEKEFGEEYSDYKKNVPRFIPKLKPYKKKTQKIYKFFEVFKFEKSTFYLILFLLTIGLILIYIK